MRGHRYRRRLDASAHTPLRIRSNIRDDYLSNWRVVRCRYALASRSTVAVKAEGFPRYCRLHGARAVADTARAPLLVGSLHPRQAEIAVRKDSTFRSPRQAGRWFSTRRRPHRPGSSRQSPPPSRGHPHGFGGRRPRSTGVCMSPHMAAASMRVCAAARETKARWGARWAKLGRGEAQGETPFSDGVSTAFRRVPG